MNSRLHMRRLLPLPVLLILGLMPIVACLNSSTSAISQRQPAPRNQVVYTLKPLLSEGRLDVRIELSVPPDAATVQMQLPVWSPGDYHVQNFARYVKAFKASATETGASLEADHADANTWTVRTAGTKRIAITYSLPTTPPGFFSENVAISQTQGFVNGPAALMYVAGQKERPARLVLELPADWRAETPLASETPPAGMTAAYSAPDYDTLADSPLVFGAKKALVTREFRVRNIVHSLVFFDHVEEIRDFDQYAPVLQKIVEAETEIMGSAPYPRYTFFCDVDGRGGGLEHLNSCRVALSPDDAPTREAPFFAHEFFHCWNIKRIRPAVLGPFDYVHPPRTRNLWFAEGVTEYYARVAVRRADLISEQGFLTHFRRMISRHQSNPARLRVTADEASQRVWESGNSSGFGGLSYYDKGELIGLCLDLSLRNATGNRKSLDDVMRLLMQRHSPPKPGYGEDEIRDTISEVAGKDMSELYNRLARSVAEMPFAECLAYAGMDINLAPLPNATEAQIALRKSWVKAKL